jgi:hypothetical protein
MKIVIYLFLTCILFLSNSSCARSQNDVADKQAVQMLKEFYTAYNTTWSTTKGYVLTKKLDSLQRKYCTKKLKNEVKEFGLDHDPLIGDDYTDAEHLKTLTVTKDSAKASAYIVSYIAHTLSASNKPIDEKVIIHVTVVKEGESFKIAAVK